MLDTKEKNEDDNYTEITESIKSNAGKILSTLEKMQYKNGDVRYDFIARQLGITNCFYSGYFLLVLNGYIETGILIFKDSRIENRTGLPGLFVNKEAFNSYINNLHRRYFLDTFSNFENSISIFLDNIIDEETNNKLLKARTKETVLELEKKGFPLNEEYLKILSRKLDTKHLTQITFDAKINELFKKVKNKDNERSDKEFIKFIQKLRNTHHNNYMYYGTEMYEYYFGDAHFLFEPKKLVVWDSGNLSLIELTLKLVSEIQNIWICITENIEFEGEIKSIKNAVKNPSCDN